MFERHRASEEPRRFRVTNPPVEVERIQAALAALIELSPAGASRHLLALRDAGIAASSRQGHEVRYRRTELGSALLHAEVPDDR